MPTFGDFETIDEPIESREESRHFTRVWQAARISVKDGRLYAVKCYIPRHGRVTEGAPKESLEEHRSLEFIEGVKQIKKVAAEGPKCLTPIHEFGLTPSGDGAWYVTDFYGDAAPILPRTLRSYITRGGKVDGAALQHTIHSIVQGCLALKRSRGCPHGNLKTTNVFRAGKPRALRKTPLVLGDAFPVAPLQLAELDAQNKLEIGDLLNATMEAHDLRAIGELILQLVEVRLLTREGDYDYPIIPSPAWNGLGKEGERWRQLCNRLLDPSLSLEGLNLESLEKELRPGFVSTHAPLLAGAAVVLCLVGGGGYFGWSYYQSAQAERIKTLYSQDMDEARSALAASESDPTNIVTALNLVEDALRRLPSDASATQLKTEVEAKRDSLFGKAFSQGTNDLAARKFEESVAQLQIATTLKPDDAEAKRLSDAAQTQLAAITLARQNEAAYQLAMKNGRGALAASDYTTALTEAGKALAVKPDDAEAKALRDEAQRQQAAMTQARQNEAAYQLAMKNGRGALAGSDYTTALTEAGKALAVKPDDAEAKALRDEAQRQQAAMTQARQNEAAYQLAMKNGRGALAGSDYTTALTEAGKALAVKPDDAEAKALRDEAERQQAANQAAIAQKEAAYQSAMKNGREALAGGDSTTALTEARKALAVKPDDADAKGLREEAQRQQAAKQTAATEARQKEAAYQSAMKNGREALAGGDSTTALTEAGKALAVKPDGADAKALRDDAQRQQAAKQAAMNQTQQNEAAYQLAMKNGRGALSGGDYTSALAEAGKALAVKPDDTDAKTLRDDAQRQQAVKQTATTQARQNEAAYRSAMKNGRGALAGGDYATALTEAGQALGVKPDDADAKGLRDEAQRQQAAKQAAISQKEAEYRSAMEKGRQFLALGDTDATKLQPALAQFQAALKWKPLDADATGDIKEIVGKIDMAFTLAFETGSKEASAGNKEEADRQLERMKGLKPGDPQVGQLAALIANMAATLPQATNRPQTTNFAGVFGRSIPDLDFVWVPGIGPGGSGAYASVNELSWDQYQALGGTEQPVNPASSGHRPADLDFDKAKALVDLLNGKPGDKNFKFRLPRLDEYKALSGVTDFAAIAGLVASDKSVGEIFRRPSDFQPREITSDVTTNKLGLRNVIGNVREWTADGVPFGNSYAWGTSGLHSVTNERTFAEQIGLRLICEPKK